MNYSIKTILDTRRANKEGMYPLKLRIIVGTRSSSISLNVHLMPNEWNDTHQRINHHIMRFNNTNRLNNRICKLKAKAYDILLQLEDAHKLHSLSISEIKKQILSERQEVTVYEFTTKLIREMKEQGRIGNALSYQATLDWISNYDTASVRYLNQITYTWLKKMETRYLAKGRKLNGLAVRMKTIRAIYNRAVAEELVPPESSPFLKYKIKLTPTKKRAISEQDFLLIKNATNLPGLRWQRSREFFLISFYLMGASFVDMAHLKVSNIEYDRIRYRRQKTKQWYDIKITEGLAELLHPYLRGKSHEDYILPIIQNHMNRKQKYKRVVTTRNNYNKYLKQIADWLGINKHNFTSYSSRHTFATIARDKEVSVSVISKMLGHTDIKTTEVYLDHLHNSVIDKALATIVPE